MKGDSTESEKSNNGLNDGLANANQGGGQSRTDRGTKELRVCQQVGGYHKQYEGRVESSLCKKTTTILNRWIMCA